MRSFILTIMLTCFVVTTNAQTPHPDSESWNTAFSGETALEHVWILASDSMKGRYSGFTGADKAENYIAGIFEGLQLQKPFGGSGFYHEFSYGAGEYSTPTYFKVKFENGEKSEFHMWQDYSIYKYSGFGKAKGRLVFVGYGISAPDKGWDELADVDVDGAVVLAMRGTPDIDGIRWEGEGASGYKSTAAFEKGAAGFMMTQGDPPKYATISEKYYEEDLPAVWISSTVADSLIKSTAKNIDEWYDEIDKNKTPVSVETKVKVEFRVSGEYYRERPTRNVAGILPGIDPNLNHELVVVGAHLDHHGVDAVGNIYPGADDNASGTAAMLETARVFVEGDKQFKRSVMFIGFGAEEEGLVGSRKFVEDLPVENYEVVAMLNMDMVGQGDGTVGIGGISDFPLLGDALFSSWPDSVLSNYSFWGLHGSSDHAPFMDVGINSYIVGAKGKHPNYHTPYDTAGAIKTEVLKNVGDMMYHCTAAIADYENPIGASVSLVSMYQNRYQGIWIRNEDYKTQNRQKFPFINYSQPIIFLTPDFWGEEGDKRCWPAMMRSLEISRERMLDQKVSWMSDSILTDFKSPMYTGATFVMEYREPDLYDEYSLKSLSRLGVGYVDLTETLKHYDDEKLKSKSFLSFCTYMKSARIRPFLRFEDIHKTKQICYIFEDQLVCYLSVAGISHEDLRLLGELKCFKIIDPGKNSVDKTVDYLSTQKESGNLDRYGIPGNTALVRGLINAEFEEYDVSGLMTYNFKEIMRQWNLDHTNGRVN